MPTTPTATEPRRCTAPRSLDLLHIQFGRDGYGPPREGQDDAAWKAEADARMVAYLESLGYGVEESDGERRRCWLDDGELADGESRSLMKAAWEHARRGDDYEPPAPVLCGEPATTERLLGGLLCPLCAEHAAEVDEEREVDLWEDSGGGLFLTDSEGGSGWRGLERGQSQREHRASPREELTFAREAARFDGLGEGGVYELMSPEDVEALYEHKDEANRPVLVATWCAGEITVADGVRIGAAARRYLGGAARS